MASRRSFGSIRRRQSKRTKRVFLEASYRVPVWASEKWPALRLPVRYVRNFPLRERPQAEAWLAQIQRQIEDGTWVPEEKSVNTPERNILFRDYARKWLKDRRRPDGRPISPSTRDKYDEYLSNHLLRFFGGRPVRTITPADVQQWWDSFPVYTDGRGESARRHVYALLKAILSTASTRRLPDDTTLLRSNPCELVMRRVPPRHTQVIATPGQLTAAYEAMPPKMRLAVYLAGVMALRRGEVLALTKDDIDPANRILHVRHSVKAIRGDEGREKVVIGSTKTTTSIRDSIIPQRLLPLITRQITDYAELEGNPRGLLFPGRHGAPINPSDLGNMWRRARAQVPGLEHMHFHDLRHTALTRLVMRGATIQEVESIAGHADIQMVMHYQHVVGEHERKVVDKAADDVDIPARNPSGHRKEKPNRVGSVLGDLAVLTPEEREELIKALKG